MRKLFLCAFPFLIALCPAQGFQYQRPPEQVAKVMEAPLPPTLELSPTGERALVVSRERYRSISDLAVPMLPLAGVRINPLNDGPARPLKIESITVRDLNGGADVVLSLPKSGSISSAAWSPDGKSIVIEDAMPDRVLLWIVDPVTGRMHSLPQAVNAALGAPYVWMPDGKTLLVKLVPSNRGPAPKPPTAPAGPEVRESLAVRRPARTFPDALRDALADEQFAYYMQSQLSLVDARSGRAHEIGKPGIFEAMPSPDGKQLLITEIHQPFSHRIYFDGFPKKVSILDLSSGSATQIEDEPSEEGVPLDGVPTGPRDFRWRADKPETLFWVEALDDGNPRKQAEFRDLLVLKDIANGQQKELLKLKHRFRNIDWTESGGIALVQEYDRHAEHTVSYVVDLDSANTTPRLLSDISSREAYANPGMPLQKELPNGNRVMVQSGSAVLFSGRGASPEGDRPFLDRVDLSTLKTDRIWRCDSNSYEQVAAVISPDGSRFVTRHESPTDPPNYFIRTGAESKQITSYSYPYADLLKVKRQLVTYTRPDGVALSFTLVLPPDYSGNGKLPAIINAYPLEFTDAATAGEVTGSTKTYPILRGTEIFVLAGYAVMDNVAMPIVGTPETVNDTYIDQLVADTKAAVDKANELGMIDTSRLGIMGHSYGAFMTANVLAHCDLIKAGAAESGAYNRTLTPFGFQSERRTFWQAEKMYLDVSPFDFADKLKHPILLIHGLEDDNQGTYTIQSERFYDAISGNGGTVRLVLLPYEAHGYVAKESLEHVAWEELTWFDKYVRGSG